MKKFSPLWAAMASVVLFSSPAGAQENLEKILAERFPELPKIDEVRPTPLNGIFEIRVDTDIFYADTKGDFVIQGDLIDARTQRSLTQERIEQITGIDFKKLPIEDAIKIVRGKGQRKMAIFADPNCGYCKKLERDLEKLNNVTIYLFPFPILGADSVQKSKNIVCAKNPAAAWEDFMIRGQAISPAAQAQCDVSSIERNLAFGRKHKITGTPTIIFENNQRVPGAIGLAQVEQLLNAKKAAAK